MVNASKCDDDAKMSLRKKCVYLFALQFIWLECCALIDEGLLKYSVPKIVRISGQTFLRLGNEQQKKKLNEILIIREFDAIFFWGMLI